MYNTNWELVIPSQARNVSGDQHWPLYRCEAPGGWLYKQSISPAGLDALTYVPDIKAEEERAEAFEIMWGEALEENAKRKMDATALAMSNRVFDNYIAEQEAKEAGHRENRDNG